MNIAGIKEKLHQYIDSTEDKKLEAIYTLLENEIDSDAQRKRLIMAEREKYINHSGKSYSADEVRAMAINHNNRRAL